MANADGSVVIDVDLNVSDAEKKLKEFEDTIKEAEKSLDSNQKSDLSETLEAAKEKAGELRKTLLSVQKSEFAPGYSKEAIEFMENYAKKFEAASEAQNEMLHELEKAEKVVKSLENQGKWFGDEDYDKAIVSLQKINSDIREYQKSLLQPEKPQNPFGLDTISGKAKEAELELDRLKAAGKGLGDTDYDKPFRKLALLKDEAKQYAAELAKTPAQAEKEADALERAAKRAEAATAKEAQEKLRNAELQAIRDNAVVADQRIVDLNKELEMLKSRLSDLKSAGVGPGFEEYDRLSERVKEINADLKGAASNAQMVSTSADPMSAAMERAEKSASRFAMRFREVVRSALVFTVITQSLARFREWLGKVVKTNAEASAAIARLKGALLTLAQPLVNIIIPAFTTFVNILTSIINAISSLLSVLFGSTIDQSKEAAENLYNETDAIEGVGAAAKKAGKSLAGFDEINKLSGETAGGGSGSKSGEILPDFSQVNSNWLADTLKDAAGMVTAALLLGGIALVAIGAAMGSLPLVLAGLALLGGGLMIGSDTGVLSSWVETLGLNNVAEFIASAILVGGIAIVVMGAVFGNVFMVIAGLALIGVTVAYAQSSGMIGDWAESLGLSKAAQFVTAALLIGGIALIALGAAMHNFLAVVAGIGMLAAGIYVGTESGAIQNWWETLHLAQYAQWVTPALLIGGIALLIFGIVMKNIGMLIAGFALLAAGVKFGIDSGTFETWWDVLRLPEYANWITPALLIGGIGLLVIGIATGNLPMLIAGLGLLGTAITFGITSGTFTRWIDEIKTGLISGWNDIKNWWETNVARFFTLDYWLGLGKNVVNGFINGIKSIGTGALKWATGIIDDIKDGVGTHSPSKKTQSVGQYTVDGFILGIQNRSPMLQTTLLQFSSMVLSQFDQLSLDLLTKQQDTQMQAQTALSLWMEIVNNLFSVFFAGVQFQADIWAANLQATLDRMVEAALAAAAAIAAAMSSAGGGSSSGSSGKSTSGKSTRAFSLANAATSIRMGVPALAAGAVIPPNREFMAVLGDQKSGTNIETPLATMVQAFKMAMQETGMGGNSTIIMEVDSQQFAKVVYKANKSESRRIGVRLVEA